MNKGKILIVEDDPLIAMTMREALTLVGFEVTGTAASVSQALSLAETTKPDLAIFDVRLAGRRDGVEGAAMLRDRLGLPAVFVTGEGDHATRERATKAGAIGYLDKPVHLKQLITVVQTAISSSGDPKKS